MAGNHHPSRVGLSILTRVGLDFFATSAPEEYVNKATALASKPEALAQIRNSMRQRMTAGSLCDVEKFTADVETAYRKMWYRWCSCQGVNVPDEPSNADAVVCYSPSDQT